MPDPAGVAAPVDVGYEPVDGGFSTALSAVNAELSGEEVAARLIAADPTIWGPDAEAEAAVRLGWLGLPTSSRALLPILDRLRDQVRANGLEHVVLAGMGGSSLAPEVIAAAAGTPLTVLDTTDPHEVRRALGDRLTRTVVVVASKSGTTVETDSHRRAYEQALRDAGRSTEALAGHFVVVTDPGTPLEAYAREQGYTVVTADPNVGGRYSALSAFGLVPTALAGVDTAEILDDAAGLLPALAGPTENPGLLLGAILGAAWRTGRDKIVLLNAPELPGFGDWAEQLIAESTGKNGRGLLPVVVPDANDPGFAGAGDDALLVAVGDSAPPRAHVRVSGPLGAQFLLWEYAIAVAGRIIGINPFDQPNVQESKDNTNAILSEGQGALMPESRPAYEDKSLVIFASGVDLPDGGLEPRSLAAVLRSVVDPGAYVAIMAYLDRFGQAEIAALRPALARQLAPVQVTFGWGPRFLHSTGQYHKGGPQVGAFLQITGAVDDDLGVPGRPYTFGVLQQAQAAGDRRALESRGRPVVRVHLKDRAAGVRALIDAVAADGGTVG